MISKRRLPLLLLLWTLGGASTQDHGAVAARRASFPSRVIVTGGAGFIGSALVKTIRRRHPATTVTVLDNLWRGKLDNLRSVGL